MRPDYGSQPQVIMQTRKPDKLATDLAGRLLHMGCGTGGFTSALRKRPCRETLSGCSLQIGSHSSSEGAFAASTADRPPRL
jgi:hypothetical protein